jgi:hypothetical protein
VISAQVSGGELTVKFLDEATKRIKIAAFQGVIEATQLAMDKSREILSLNDHTLAELGLLDHPYSVRHPQVIHSPDESVHAQSGEYLSGLRAYPPVGVSSGVYEGRVTNEDEKDRWIQEGTLRMRARPWAKWITRMFGDRMISIIRNAVTAVGGRA